MKVLFVCLGNICRSPTAEGVFRHVLRERLPHLQFELDSAGTHDYHPGASPDRRAIAAATRRRIDISQLRARKVRDEDFDRFDLILAMDEDNLRDLKRRAKPGAKALTRLVLEYAMSPPRTAVPDPYYGGPEGFEEVLDLLEAAAEGFSQQYK